MSFGGGHNSVYNGGGLLSSMKVFSTLSEGALHTEESSLWKREEVRTQRRTGDRVWP